MLNSHHPQSEVPHTSGALCGVREAVKSVSGPGRGMRGWHVGRLGDGRLQLEMAQWLSAHPSV